MREVFVWWVLSLTVVVTAYAASDIPPQRGQALNSLASPPPAYYWQVSVVGNTAQLLTLFCRSCESSGDLKRDIPLVAVLRDTLGDESTENDRVASVWLLTYSRPNIGRKLLSAVPFFFWRTGQGASSVSARDTKPLFDLTQPQHPVMSEVGRNLLQWTMLDGMTTPVRATSRAYRMNQLDYERLHLEEAISYLRDAPVSNDSMALNSTQLNTVIARLELRKRLLGGLVTETNVARVGEESGFQQERIRSRNWELLRQCAEKTGLLFEPMTLAGSTGQYAILWFPQNAPSPSSGTSLAPVWKLLNIKNPWTDNRLKNWQGPVYTRSLDEGGSLLPPGQAGTHAASLVPLGVYGLHYPKLPLLLVDFRDGLHGRRQEMIQRSVNEVTAGVIGISHFTNWYYYVAADLYDFVIARHGGAVNQSARLDAYSRFRAKLALDQDSDPQLRQEMQRRVSSLAVNPLEASPGREMEIARFRSAQLATQLDEGGRLTQRMDKERRAELAAFGQTRQGQLLQDFFHTLSLGLYTHRVKPDPENLAALDRQRRVQYHLDFLTSLAEAETRPEVAYDSARIRASVYALNILMPGISSPEVRQRAEAVLLRLKSLSQDGELQSDCSLALASLKRSEPAHREIEVSGVFTSAHSASASNDSPEAGQ